MDPTHSDLPLPMTRAEMARRGWDQLDVLLVSGDAYVDHPSFGAALLGRWLQAHGYRVGVVAQPRWDDTSDLTRMGPPHLLVGITAGALDSMLSIYTAFRARRRTDAYASGGRTGLRPRRASIVYANLARRAFPGVPIVLGGIEASLRRATHYDFWSDGLRRSILLDARADLLLHGMAERTLLELVQRLDRGQPDPLHDLPGSVRVGHASQLPPGADPLPLPSHEAILQDPMALMQATLALERQAHQGTRWAIQRCGDRDLLLGPPAAPLTTAELDRLYTLPFTREPHPSYTEPIPAAEMIRFSVTSHRGCVGGCSFCSLSLHQGRTIASRSADSITQEVARMTRHPAWRGSVTDVGGPSANMYGARCTGDVTTCERVSCLFPRPCKELASGQSELTALHLGLARLPGVRHVRVASGVRHDLALMCPEFLELLVGQLTGGQLKLAPEHISSRVLKLMRKSSLQPFEEFLERFGQLSQQAGRRQFVVPYLMSAFPGCTDDDMRELTAWLRARGWHPQQVQCFVPTPGTVATAMFYSERDERGHPIPVARTDAERLRQHRMLANRG